MRYNNLDERKVGIMIFLNGMLARDRENKYFFYKVLHALLSQMFMVYICNFLLLFLRPFADFLSVTYCVYT